MKAMVLNEVLDFARDIQPLELVDMPLPVPGENEILVKVSRCGVCNIELDGHIVLKIVR